MNSCESECKSECKSKENLDSFNELIENMNNQLNEYEKCLKSMRINDEAKQSKSKEIKEAIHILENEISDYESKLFQNRTLTYEPMKNFSQIEKIFGKILVRKNKIHKII